jgi:hypothetical protein
MLLYKYNNRKPMQQKYHKTLKIFLLLVVAYNMLYMALYFIVYIR